MAVVLAPSQPAGLSLRRMRWSWVGIGLKERRRSIRVVPLATAGVVAICVAFPLIEVARIAVSWPPLGGKGLQALVATACYLPLYVRVVVHGVRGSRPAGAGRTLLAMTVVILGALPFIGVGWLSALHSLAVSVLLVIRGRWSLVVFAGLVAAPIPLAIALGAPEYGPYYAVAVAWRSLALFVVIWLLDAIRQLQAARLALAEEAVTRERLRIDGELRRTLGSALETITGQATRASAQVGRSPATVADELRRLVDRARQTLAEARRLVGGYQRVSLRGELDTAATLLTAAGIKTRVVLPAGALPDAMDEPLRSALRSATARLLRDDATRSCVITVVRQEGRVRLEFRSEQTGPAMTEAATT
jgi:two-component system sensor histidine kinase DesK